MCTLAKSTFPWAHCVCLYTCRLDLDKWIYDPPSDSEDEFKTNDLTFMLGSGGGGNNQLSSYVGRSKKGKKKKGKKGAGGGVDGEESEDEEEMEKVRQWMFIVCCKPPQGQTIFSDTPLEFHYIIAEVVLCYCTGYRLHF